jgi:hypothetical protein
MVSQVSRARPGAPSIQEMKDRKKLNSGKKNLIANS